MTAWLRVVSIAPGASLQDYGRHGLQRYGIAEGGVMDRVALAEGMALLNNQPNDAVIEFSGNGGEFEVCGGAMVIACTGAAMGASIDNCPLVWRSTMRVEAGQRITIGAAGEGVYGYLHVQKGFAVPMVLGSRGTHTRAGFGGFNGRFLKAGDELPVYETQNTSCAYLSVNTPVPPRSKSIRVVWGAQADKFSEDVRERFLNTVFTVSAARDRMGARLTCDTQFMSTTGLSGISDAVLSGDVQIGGDGMATVLLSDRQPTGGYPRIATVISADLHRFVQLPVLSEFRFHCVSIEEAVEALAVYRDMQKRLPDNIAPLHRDPAEIADLLSYNLIDGVVDARDIHDA